MAEIYSALFIVQFFGLVSIFFAQAYNLMKVGEFYNLKVAFLLLFGSILTFGMGRSIAIIEHTETLIVQVFKLEAFIFILCFVLFLVDLVMELGLFGSQQIERFNSKKNRELRY